MVGWTAKGVAAVGVVLLLSGCMGNADDGGPEAGASPPVTAAPSQSATPGPSASPSTSSAPSADSEPTATPAAPESPPSVPAEESVPAEKSAEAEEHTASEELPDATTFTTRDGIYSFDLPSDWTAEAVQPPERPAQAESVIASAFVIRDAAGERVAKFIGGIPGGGDTQPSPGHIPVDSAPVPQLATASGNPVTFVFDYRTDPVTGHPYYEARLEEGAVPADGTYDTPLGLVGLRKNGQAQFISTLEPGMFATEAQARDWMTSMPYRQLKAMFASLRLND